MSWMNKARNAIIKMASKGEKIEISTATIKEVMKHAPYNTIAAEYQSRQISDGGYKRQATIHRAKEIKDWVNGIMEATDPDRPRRSQLFRVWQNLLLDDHLQTTIDNRVLPLQQASVNIIDANGNIDEEATKLIERPWMHDLMRLFIMSKIQGATLVRMSDLNEMMELKQVEEYPQCNFVAQEGIILNDESDTSGMSYKEGALENYFVQFGNDWSLGMLNELAIIILAKKLSLGSWMSFIEKYGVPPIFAITERMDPKRRDELFDMLADFQSNHFAVLQGTEKVEVGKEIAGTGNNAFSPLLERGDRQISRRILGQTGTTSNEAFVGTAEVHERVEEKRHTADKLLFGFYFNTIIIPKLVKISPVYSILEGKTLEWDNAEKMTVTEYIKAIVDLGDTFDFDAEEVKARTGLPITGIKAATAVPTATTKTKPVAIAEKKKDDLNIVITASATFDNIFEKVIQRVYDEKVEAGDIDVDTFNETYKQLRKAAASGWGESFNDAEADNRETSQTMRDNLYRFSGAKSYQELKDMNTSLFDAEGNKKPFTEFRKEALKINADYNENWLSAEYDTAMSSAQMAEKWAGYEANKSLFPNLKYVAVNDQHTRPEHSALDGTVKPVDDGFWSTNYPPNGFRCRCHVEPTAEEATGGTPSISIDYRFAQNVGKTGTPFVASHPYFSIPKNQLSKVDKQIELQKAFAPTYKDTKSNVKISDFADKKRLPELLSNARIIQSETDTPVTIQPLINLKEVKVQDYELRGKAGKLSSVNNIAAISSSLNEAISNECLYSVLNFDKIEALNKQDLHKALTKLQKTGTYDDLTLILIRDKNAVKVPFKSYSENELKKL